MKMQLIDILISVKNRQHVLVIKANFLLIPKERRLLGHSISRLHLKSQILLELYHQDLHGYHNQVALAKLLQVCLQVKCLQLTALWETNFRPYLLPIKGQQPLMQELTSNLGIPHHQVWQKILPQVWLQTKEKHILRATQPGQMETMYLHLMAETVKSWKEIQQDTYQNSAMSVGLNTLQNGQSFAVNVAFEEWFCEQSPKKAKSRILRLLLLGQLEHFLQ